MNPMSRWLKVVVLAVVLMPLFALQAAPPPMGQTMVTRPAGQVSGMVVDEAGEPMFGVTVIAMGTTVTTATDVEGRFALQLPAGDCMLQFTYVGYESQTLAPGPQMRVQLMPGRNALSEVVVTALGIKREAKALSYHVQQVENDAIMRVQDANFVNSLNGKLAGVQINANASGIGGSSRVVMRGAKSIDGNNNVLYVIDGVPLVNTQSGLDDDALAFSGSGQTGDATAMLNPDDIASISALTGPSAAALYGSDAANGVILITTKKGMPGRTEVTYNGSFQFSRPLRLPKFQNTYGQTEPGSYYSWGDRLATPSDYNPVDFFRTATHLTNAISLSTGNDRNQTYVSLAATNAGGIIHNNDLDRYNVSARNTTKAFGDRVVFQPAGAALSVSCRSRLDCSAIL